MDIYSVNSVHHHTVNFFKLDFVTTDLIKALIKIHHFIIYMYQYDHQYYNVHVSIVLYSDLIYGQ